MKRVLVTLTSVLAVAACAHTKAPAAPAPASQPAALTPAQIASRSMPSIVLIRTPTQLGTGFVVWQDGRIATNLHVIAGAREAKVILADGREFSAVEVLAADPPHDLVVLRVPAKQLPALTLGDPGKMRPGDRVVAIGHPLGLGNTVSDGLVSAVRVVDPSLTVLQISAPIAPGSSGGPVFNEHGEVIGVATAFASEGQNLGFGMPVTYLKPLLLSDTPTSLASFSQKLEASLLEGCPTAEVELAVKSISEAIHTGAPLYNQGDKEGCYKLYQSTALQLVDKLATCAGIKDTLLGGLSAANHASNAGEKAWALRHAFDRILSALEAAIKRQ